MNIVLFPKLHTHRINAVPNASLVAGTIGESVAQVSSTGSTKDLFANHEVAVVHLDLNRFGADGLGEAWPTAAAVVLEVGVKNGVATALAGIDACFLIERIGTGKWSFRSFLAQDLVGQGVQLVLPLFFGFLDGVDFIFHR